MWETIKKQFRVQRWDGMAGTLFAAAVGLLFVIVSVAARGILGEKSYIELGTVLAGICMGVFALVGTGLSFYTSFQIEVGLGSTRKHFFISFYLYSLILGLINGLLLLLFYEMEHGLYGVLYPGVASELEMMPFLPVLVLYLAVVLPMLGISAAAAVMRFGKIAFWIMWAFWMLGFLVIPRFLGAAKDQPQSVYGILGKGLMGAAAVFPRRCGWGSFWRPPCCG